MTLTRLTILALLCAAPALAQSTPIELEEKTLRHDGLNRRYFLHTPPRPRTGRLPVLFVLHGGGGQAGENLAKSTGFVEIADREGFLLVYPEGQDKQWNDGRGISFPVGDGDVSDVDDVGFIDALITRVIQRHRGDRRRIYVTGLSNGGMMTHRLGIELSERIAAIAPIVAGIPVDLAHQFPSAPLPVLIMNGTEDPLMPYRGGPVTVFGEPYGQVLSAQNSVNYWSLSNGGGVPSETRQLLPDVDPNDDSRVIVHSITGLRAPVVLYAIHGGGHTLPGGPGTMVFKRLVGNKNMDISGPEVIWAFVQRFSR